MYPWKVKLPYNGVILYKIIMVRLHLKSNKHNPQQQWVFDLVMGRPHFEEPLNHLFSVESMYPSNNKKSSNGGKTVFLFSEIVTHYFSVTA